ncbi:hypothetical protein B0O80DRAFT_454181 [Mortierella sp. GBAus27b]|nr:hypothetical protein B0O80DRAFT_454181 [Mortierella sp. GBAus27b]
MLWNVYSISAAPLPQSSDVAAPPVNASVDGLTDPFTTPDYLEPSTFTWEQAFYGVLFLFIGGVELIHGYKYIRFTMLVAGYLVWASTAVMIMILVDSNNGSYQSSSEYFAIWLAVGIVGALISFHLWHVGILLTGAYGTFLLMAIILTAANLTNYTARYIILAIFIIAGGYLTKRYERIAVILATSAGGAYCLMYGLDMFVQTGFRSTLHVMLSTSNATFHSNVGSWVMVACVPVIALFGIVWELKHHETPVGSYWLGDGAKPLPPLPGEKPPRRCCGFVLARSKKAVKADAEKARREGSNSTTGLGNAGLSGSDVTLVPPPTESTSHRSCCLPWCAKRDKNKGKSSSNPTSGEATTPSTTPSSPSTESAGSVTTDVVVPVPATKEDAAEDKPDSSPSSTTKIPSEFRQEAMVQGGIRRVTIQREEREFELEVEEKL